MMCRLSLLVALLTASCWACDDGDGGGGAPDAAPLEEDTGPAPRCGDTVVDEGEDCDDGNSRDGDGCNARCELESCGDGVVQPGEGCDDGNTEDADGCSRQCQPEVCGNRVVDPGEACDDGNTEAGDGCDADCRLERCGNGTLDEGEACDDGNLAAGDNCDPSCQIECGDGEIDPGEACDDGNTEDGDGCAADCSSECGNGRIDGIFEECDDGNTEDGDACSADCLLECGNGVIDGDEACDDGNGLGGDGCDADCEVECGNGVLDGDEECDDGNTVPDDGCSAQCAYECGDGVRGGAEECDDGNLDDGDGCSSDCTLECGDGVVAPELGETCDDGNRVGGDGCDPTCRIECGNGLLEAEFGETCDDGNQAAGDGCDAACQLECGNGVLDGDEECDDGDDDDDDACSNSCTLACGNGILEPALGEECDVGDREPGDGCDAECRNECGNGVVDPGEECDDPALMASGRCSPACEVVAPGALEIGDREFVSGELGDRTWNPPADNCGASPHPDHFYATHELVNATGGPRRISVSAALQPSNSGRILNALFTIVRDPFQIITNPNLYLEYFSGTLHVFRERFEPACGRAGCEEQGCIVGRANGPYNALEDIEMAPGETLVVVVSGQLPFPYDLEIGPAQAPPRVAVCGDGIRDEGEACDDGNLDERDGCDSSCNRSTIELGTRYGLVEDDLLARGRDVIRLRMGERGPLRVNRELIDGDCAEGIAVRISILLSGEPVAVAGFQDCDAVELDLPRGFLTVEVESSTDAPVPYRLLFTRGLLDAASPTRPGSPLASPADPDLYELEVGAGQRVGVTTSGNGCEDPPLLELWPDGGAAGMREVGPTGCEILMLPEGAHVVQTAMAGRPYEARSLRDGPCGDGVVNFGEVCDGGASCDETCQVICRVGFDDEQLSAFESGGRAPWSLYDEIEPEEMPPEADAGVVVVRDASVIIDAETVEVDAAAPDEMDAGLDGGAEAVGDGGVGADIGADIGPDIGPDAAPLVESPCVTACNAVEACAIEVSDEATCIATCGGWPDYQRECITGALCNRGAVQTCLDRISVAGSGFVGHNEDTVLRWPLVAEEAGRIAFDYRVSSEAGYDFLVFAIDDVEQARWSGEVPWSRAEYELPPGPHVLTWQYIKDQSVDAGEDRAFVDNVLITAPIDQCPSSPEAP